MDGKQNGYLTDDEGHPSSMRLMGMVALMAATAFGILTLLDGAADDYNGLYLTTAFLLGAFAPKALQKFAERKFPLPAPDGPNGPKS